ncbi:DNA polymerase III subunit alpha [Ectobacillus sp. JY-23]|uniref:DNA polymerase III subunit alpha n=1 Tax=Ectobacillus sp. JY-23 TaxID=2933872 RepID=UPI001FF2E5B1|nr:DNA polymerase III subunit alpha [Ectobacillus sp. JY-23]UOY94286.1 DNA polymerase III subunit alpha [Ectobacillus sp. JY-23]
MNFVHLQCQTVYSLLKSTCAIEQVVKRAKELGMEALAITDENVMYGVIPFYKACKKEGIKPIIGLTASVLGGNTSYPLVLLAENEIGYRNLIKISSSIMTKAKEGIPKQWLSRYAEGIIAISPGQQGEIEQKLLNRQEQEALETVQQYKSMFSSFYLSIQNHDLIQEQWLQARLYQLHLEAGVPLVALNDVRYVHKSEASLHDCLLCIEEGVLVTDEKRTRMESEEYWLKSPEEMEKLFRDMPEALVNTTEIAAKCEVEIELGVQRLPKFPVPVAETADHYLRSLCEQALLKRCPHADARYHERLHHELEVIARMGFSDYFLIVWDFMQYAHKQNILTGPGRGSAAGSLVSYVLQITDIDPIAYDLLFERFLNPERITLPDIDIDFPDIRRDEIIRYVANKYGKLHVAQIVTFGTLAAKAAVRDIARAHGLDPKEIDRFSKAIPSKPGTSLESAYHQSERLREYVHSTPLYERIFELARQAEGLPRHTSVHAAGVIVSDEPLTEHVAIQEGHEVYITQYPAEALEGIGMLKMDFLGLRNLTVLENVIRYIKRTEKKDIYLQELPLDDENTFRLLGEGDTTGVFQLESQGMRNVLKNLRPNAFEDLIAVNALYRPGPMEQIPNFIEAKHGRHKIHYIHPHLEPILKRTYGVIVYQEQIMQIASQIAGFSLGEADLLRRAVSKKKRDILDEERRHFVQGCLQNGYEEQAANEIYDLIVRFADYGFNRSHAAAYSMISYQLAYLKANYPLAFMAALLSSAIGNEEKLAQYVNEAKRKGIPILPPSIQSSGYRFEPEQGSIRYSLLAIRNIGGATVKEIIEERQKGRYRDLFDFCVRLPSRVVARRNLETFIYAGCFDEFASRSTLLASLDTALEYRELVRPAEESVFLDEELIPKPIYKEAIEPNFMEMLQREKEVIGFYISASPITPYKKLIEDLRLPSLQKASEETKKSFRVIAFITRSNIIRTKNLQKMAFLTLGDETEVEAVMFPDTYLLFGHQIMENQLMLIECTLGVRNGKKQWVVTGLYKLDEPDAYERHRESVVYIKLPSEADKRMQQEVMTNAYHYPGYAKTLIYYEKEHKMIQLSRMLFVQPSEECLQALKKIAGEKNVVCK